MNNTGNPPAKSKSVYKERWDLADLLGYYYYSGCLLQDIVVPNCTLFCQTGCQLHAHKAAIDIYYNSIVCALKRASDACVPKIRCGSLKAFWNADLDKLKEKSIDMHKLWRTCGSPRSGIINSARLTAKLDYKQAIKHAAVEYEKSNADELNACFAKKDKKSFWKCWNAKSKNNTGNSASINGQNDPVLIANAFKTHFAQSYINSADDIQARTEFADLLSSKAPELCDASPEISIELVEQCIKELSCNKAAGHDGLVAEHVIHSHPSIVVHLKLLFSMILLHTYVPNEFGMGTVIPIIKDKRGDLNAMENYRPITLSPIISKIFESLMLAIYSKFMGTDDLQFGF